MKNLAIIGASYLQLPLIEKAKEMGFKTHVFAWEANDVGEKKADFFYPISITEKEEIAIKCKEIGVCGICSIATDLGNITVNYVANKLGLVGNSMQCIKKSTNKYLMREAFKQMGDPSPKSIITDNTLDLKKISMSFPVVVKPTDRSGSRGIYKIDSMDGLPNAIREAKKVSFEKKVLIEEYVDGDEYSVEGISYKGEHHILAITQKCTTGAPRFIETCHIEPATIDSVMYLKVSEVIMHALNTLEIENGASHSEIKIDKQGNIKIIEIGARMGGDAIGSDLVRYSTGIDFVKAVIQVSCGEKPDLNPSGEKCMVESRYILNELDLEEFRKIQRDEPQRILKIVDEVHLDRIGKVTDSSNRAGCYIVKV